jgi:hypothetical protein
LHFKVENLNIKQRWERAMNRTISIFLASVAFSFQAFSQDTTNFFPHHLGDLHIYDYFVTIWDPPTTVIWKDIFDSTGSDGTSYIIKKESWPQFSIEYYHYYRIDTAGNVQWRRDIWPDSDYVYFKLNAIQGDHWIVNHYGPGGELAIVESTYTTTSFDISTISKEIAYYTTTDTSDTTQLGFHLYSYILSGGFGIVFYGGGEMFDHVYLRAACIDGVVYGDTTTSAVEDRISQVPRKIELFQNYPNPFNASTIIQYYLLQGEYVNLKIYNMLGQEVAVIVNGNQKSGRHKIEFQSNTLASGIYIYTLQTGTFRESRRMIILK